MSNKTSSQVKHPRVGIGVVVIKDNKILLGKRKGSHGAGSWCFPGGHLDFGETCEGCAIREVKEETGIEIKNITFAVATNDFMPKENKHYITIHMRSDYKSGKVKLLEPDKCERWEWFDLGSLPTPLFLPTNNALKQYNPLKNV